MTSAGSQHTPGPIRRFLADEMRRVTFQRSFAHRRCAHLTDVPVVPEPPLTCPACERDSSRWVHMRMCLTCGSVGCCDSSPGLHALSHYQETGHAVMRSIEPGESWAWCYVDKAYLTLREGPAGTH